MIRDFLAGPVLLVLAAVLAAPGAVRADDDVLTQSCTLLEQSADARTEKLYDAITDNLLKWGRWRRFKTYMGDETGAEISPNRLPEAIRAFRKRLPARVFALARTIRGLRGTSEAVVAAGRAEIDLAMDSAERWFAEWETDKRSYATAKRWDSHGMRYEICGTDVRVGSGLGRLSVCGVIDLSTGQTSYVIDQVSAPSRYAGRASRVRPSVTWSNPNPLVNLGPTEPIDAYNDLLTRAFIHSQLRVAQQGTLPDECRKPSAHGPVSAIDTDDQRAKSVSGGSEMTPQTRVTATIRGV